MLFAAMSTRRWCRCSALTYGALNVQAKNDALYYEVLDMSLAELDTKKNVKVTWLSEGITKEVSICANLATKRLMTSS